MKTFLFLSSSCFILVLLLMLISGEISKIHYLFQFLFLNKKYTENFKSYNDKEMVKYNKVKNEKEDNQIQSAKKLKKRILWAIFAVIIIAIYTFLISLLANKLNITLRESHYIIIQMFALIAVFLALLSQMGWELQTIKGLTLNEYINSLWYRILSVISIHLILFCSFNQLIFKSKNL